jgi:hypothetical protein
LDYFVEAQIDGIILKDIFSILVNAFSENNEVYNCK